MKIQLSQSSSLIAGLLIATLASTAAQASPTKVLATSDLNCKVSSGEDKGMQIEVRMAKTPGKVVGSMVIKKHGQLNLLGTNEGTYKDGLLIVVDDRQESHAPAELRSINASIEMQNLKGEIAHLMLTENSSTLEALLTGQERGGTWTGKLTLREEGQDPHLAYPVSCTGTLTPYDWGFYQ